MTLPSGQLQYHEEREPISPAMPEGNVRTTVVRLFPSGAQQKKIRRLADASARLYNEVNYERRQQFFKDKRVDFKGTWDKYYEKYKRILGSANAQAVLQKDNEAWSSFFSLLKNKDSLPPFTKHVSPPGYWKENEKRKLILVVRQDRYEVDEERRVLILKDWKMEIPFAGRLRWFGTQGRLEVHIDGDKFYAHIPVDVGRVTTKKSKRPMKESLIVHGERDRVQVKTPKGEKVASIDLGINMLATVTVDDGTVLFYRGSTVKADYFYFQKKVAELDKLKAEAEKVQETEAREEVLSERERLFKRLYRRLLHHYRALSSHLSKTLWQLGVSTVYLGYPYSISQDKGNKFTSNIWSYRKLVEAITDKLHEYGIKAYLTVEYNTSRLCALHGVVVERKPRGVVSCPLGHRLHSDINGALNIMKLGIKRTVNVLKKPLSFLVSSNGVTPVKGSNTSDLGGTLAL
ncbi:transposase [Metallosphaera tengchongensis]|uniref:Transposase n=1 Tax=Metallosphaera tengchongensis TaxID=1532350 RepID=A0A6N0NT15_9CREN|nr:RNA-guided endonuclease TnpB family protein [Metallosphaera tengchongensis]QKQ99885.1 transposase [Metallosphaera tengchongensis]